MMAMQVENHQSPGQAQLPAQQSQAYGAATSAAEAGTGSTTLAVTNLPYRIRWQDLKDLFRRYGTPSRADVFLAPDGRSRGVGMVSMRTRREAENCVNDLNGYEWYGRKIGVKIDETGGHHALAAAAMAGATIWEGVGFTQQSSTDTYEVTPFTHITSFTCAFTLYLEARDYASAVREQLGRKGTCDGWTGVFVAGAPHRCQSFVHLTNLVGAIGTFPADADLPCPKCKYRDHSLSPGRPASTKRCSFCGERKPSVDHPPGSPLPDYPYMIQLSGADM
jgi:hypothetical protein